MTNTDYLNLSDEVLIERIAALDEAAFNVLFERYGDNMLRYFYRMLNQNDEVARDFVQDLFVKVIEYADRFDAGRKFSPWIYQMASNMCKNEYRRRSVRGIREEVQEGLPIQDSIEEELERKIFSKDLLQALDSLSPTHKEAFVLRYQEELSIKEIAEVMQCSTGTVKTRIFYMLKKLAGQLEQYRPQDTN